MPRIVVYIDESGNPFENEIAFSTAAAWCTVERNAGREKPLESTIDSMKQYLIDDGKFKWAKEIHHRGMPDDYVEFLIFLAVNKARTDDTILQDQVYWDRSPLRFTMNAGNPHAIECLNPEMNPQRLGNFMRLSAIGNLLRPFSTYQGTEELMTEIVLDAEVWESVIERYDPGLRRMIGNARVKSEIHYCRSAKTPGLQIADLAAGIVRQYLLKSTQKAAYRLLLSNELICIKSTGL